MSKYPRKKLLIYPDFQLRIIIFSVGMTIVILAAVLGALNSAFSTMLVSFEQAGFANSEDILAFIRGQQSQVMLIIVIISLLCIAASALLALVVTHRMAGPIIRVRRHLEEVAYGMPWKPLADFRKGDYFSDLPAILNRAVEKIRNP